MSKPWEYSLGPQGPYVSRRIRQVTWSGPTACVECRTTPYRHALCHIEDCACSCHPAD